MIFRSYDLRLSFHYTAPSASPTINLLHSAELFFPTPHPPLPSAPHVKFRTPALFDHRPENGKNCHPFRPIPALKSLKARSFCPSTHRPLFVLFGGGKRRSPRNPGRSSLPRYVVAALEGSRWSVRSQVFISLQVLHSKQTNAPQQKPGALGPRKAPARRRPPGGAVFWVCTLKATSQTSSS